jgi:hypothetical protein
MLAATKPSMLSASTASVEGTPTSAVECFPRRPFAFVRKLSEHDMLCVIGLGCEVVIERERGERLVTKSSS